jgi:hypothetical protein
MFAPMAAKDFAISDFPMSIRGQNRPMENGQVSAIGVKAGGRKGSQRYRQAAGAVGPLVIIKFDDYCFTSVDGKMPCPCFQGGYDHGTT